MQRQEQQQIPDGMTNKETDNRKGKIEKYF
jgi:hypothetical protein